MDPGQRLREVLVLLEEKAPDRGKAHLGALRRRYFLTHPLPGCWVGGSLSP